MSAPSESSYWPNWLFSWLLLIVAVVVPMWDPTADVLNLSLLTLWCCVRWATKQSQSPEKGHPDFRELPPRLGNTRVPCLGQALSRVPAARLKPRPK